MISLLLAALLAPAGSEAVGGYSKGCLFRGIELPVSVPGVHLIRLGRRRNFGHQRALDFLRSYGERLQALGVREVLVGDIALKKGGPMPSGHRSHQLGLDIDVWFTHPDPRRAQTPTRKAVRAFSFPSLVDRAKEKVNPRRWKDEHRLMLRAAATSDRVARIFVNAAIKGHLCETVPAADRGWLRKIRPWWGHDAHFHVRLACDPSDLECRDQAAISEGDGCEHVAWFSRAAVAARKKAGHPKGSRRKRHPMPERCRKLLGVEAKK